MEHVLEEESIIFSVPITRTRDIFYISCHRISLTMNELTTWYMTLQTMANKQVHTTNITVT